MRVLAAAIVITGLAVAACSPARDWRQVQPEGTALVAAMPCKPASLVRRVTLDGSDVDLAMYACTADGLTVGIGHADVGDPARVAGALQAMRRSAVGNIDGTVSRDEPAAVPGMTPNPSARVVDVEGRRPGGGPVRLRVVVFAHGTRVFQVTAHAPALDEATLEEVFRGLRLGRG